MDTEALNALRRWEEAGGYWHVLTGPPGRLRVELRRCDGGELVGHLESDDPEFVVYATRNEPT